ncbi:hypothetical protein [Pontibacterium sp.]|uniref:hypothetical protein n=1 Tax=Pontibacterium sp. TaxID=2036026 RepID=UPI0035152448
MTDFAREAWGVTTELSTASTHVFLIIDVIAYFTKSLELGVKTPPQAGVSNGRASFLDFLKSFTKQSYTPRDAGVTAGVGF